MANIDRFVWSESDVQFITPPTKLPELTDAPRQLGPGARSRLEIPSRSTIGRIAQVAKKLESLGEVEIITAGDEDVCPICLDLEDGGPYSIDEARSLIPAHPYCRCAFAPVEEQ